MTASPDHSSPPTPAADDRERWGEPSPGEVGVETGGTERIDASREAAEATPEKDHGFWMRLHTFMHRHPVTGAITKVVVTLVGVVVILAGFVMMVTPGPGLVAVLLGLAILATEWPWAEKVITWLKERAAHAARTAREMDPAVRRRHILTVLGVTVAVVGIVVGYLVWQGWPGWSVSLWDKVQGLSDKIPELPGM